MQWHTKSLDIIVPDTWFFCVSFMSRVNVKIVRKKPVVFVNLNGRYDFVFRYCVQKRHAYKWHCLSLSYVVQHCTALNSVILQLPSSNELAPKYCSSSCLFMRRCIVSYEERKYNCFQQASHILIWRKRENIYKTSHLILSFAGLHLLIRIQN